jgi:hypothetical protein
MSSVEILAAHNRLIAAVAGLTAVLLAGLAVWVRVLLRRDRGPVRPDPERRRNANAPRD